MDSSTQGRIWAALAVALSTAPTAACTTAPDCGWVSRYAAFGASIVPMPAIVLVPANVFLSADEYGPRDAARSVLILWRLTTDNAVPRFAAATVDTAGGRLPVLRLPASGVPVEVDPAVGAALWPSLLQARARLQLRGHDGEVLQELTLARAFGDGQLHSACFD